MKRPNNKYRNNNSNNSNNNGYSSQVYSLNYRFDSNSIAGKCNGTALELIKRYNELAKDALNNSDIVTAELFRQYAEHYRKIVTDINDKKAAQHTNRQENNRDENRSENVEANSQNSENQNASASDDASKNDSETSDNVISIEKKHQHRKPFHKRNMRNDDRSYDGTNNKTETSSNSQTPSDSENTVADNVAEKKVPARKSFKVVEVKEENKNSVLEPEAKDSQTSEVKPKRVYKKKVLTAEAV